MPNDHGEWSRHFDSVKWTVISIMTAALGGLLVFVSDKADPMLPVTGLILTVVLVFFAASFRLLQKQVNTAKQGDTLEALTRSPTAITQWQVLVVFLLWLVVLWVRQLIGSESSLALLWILLGVSGAATIGALAVIAGRRDQSDRITGPAPVQAAQPGAEARPISNGSLLRTFIQATSLLLTTIGSAFLAKGNLQLSPAMIANLSGTAFGYNQGVVRAFANQRGDALVGMGLLLIATLLQVVNLIWTLRWMDLRTNRTGVVLAVIVSATLAAIGWFVSDYVGKLTFQQAHDLLAPLRE